MKVKYKDSLKFKILNRIEQISGNVILRSDVADLGGYRQLSFALKSLVDEGKLARVAFGIYAKTFKSKYTGNYILNDGIANIAKEAFDRLGIRWDLTTNQKAYNERRTTQIPVRPAVRLKSRFRRIFAYKDSVLQYEGGVNAR